MANILLEMKNITKRFPGVKALDNVNLKVEEGEIHALVGENGAGKSTLMNILSGIYPYGSYEGDILYDGEECRFSGITDSEKKGIAIIHQELALIPFMSISENIFLGNERGTRYRIDWEETDHKAKDLLNTVGLLENPRTLIKDIGVGKQQLVEIAKALAKNVRLLILDEPTASLNEADSRKLLDLLLSFKEKGLTSIIISHKLNEISYIADKITILRDGATIETLDNKAEVISEERIIKGMVGRTMTDRFPKRNETASDKISFEVKNWNVYHPIYEGRKVVDNVSLYVRRGEVVGIAGLMGAGRTELALSIFGKSYGVNISGTLIIDGKEVKLQNAHKAIENGLAYITEDRKGDGLILTNPIRVNTTLAGMEKVSRKGIVDHNEENRATKNYIEKLRTKCTSIEQDVGNLSGGNQQKVLISKWMFTDPDIMILDEPTRGIDVGAKYEIYCIINQLVAEGKSILMISSELPELIGMCDRIYVMNEGRIVGEVMKEDATQELIMGQILKSSKGV
ncbi:sugar ABC transporter ATP-binding protein [Lachnospiraceae bacterium MD1]|uniref:Sugar ABC transporter ATP-binding protein n=1 Tax=Variimorphobacter saccharofermentans TaxID=2755051 RepID=A0A839JY79_9FIRM|nr:multiple monosaccharide ABC transporter ATP-binding protein [Variimorphobacter saccharofermentans]MBB2182623.1 sugar ABC transporter ATP-binding protein [Variimorphobacter saccharofermentans]